MQEAGCLLKASGLLSSDPALSDCITCKVRVAKAS